MTTVVSTHGFVDAKWIDDITGQLTNVKDVYNAGKAFDTSRLITEEECHLNMLFIFFKRANGFDHTPRSARMKGCMMALVALQLNPRQ